MTSRPEGGTLPPLSKREQAQLAICRDVEQEYPNLHDPSLPMTGEIVYATIYALKRAGYRIVKGVEVKFRPWSGPTTAVTVEGEL